MTPEYNIVFMQLPTSIRGFTKENADGSYTIAINACFDRETQQKTCQHEIEHIFEGDLDSDAPVQKIESMRHTIAATQASSGTSDPIPRRKRHRRHRKQYQYYEQRAAFFQEYFSEDQRWQIAESQHLYKDL